MKKIALSEREKHTLLSLLVGGAATGVGLGALTSALGHARTLSSQASRDEELRKATLPVRLLRPVADEEGGQVKKAFDPFVGGVGLAGGVIGGTLSYQLVRKLYDMFNLKETERRLVNAQEGYEDALIDSVVNGQHIKKAGGDVKTTPGISDLLTWLVVAGVPLTGYVAHKASQSVLNKAFPASNFADNIAGEMGGRPVRVENIRLPRRAPEAGQPSQDEEDLSLQKTASADPMDGLPFASFVLHGAMSPEQRAASSTWGWVKVAAHCPEVLDNISPETSMRDMQALAESAPDPDAARSVIATTLLTKQAGLGTQFGILVAGELSELLPMSYGEAAQASPEVSEALTKLASDLGAELFLRAFSEQQGDTCLIKEATAGMEDAPTSSKENTVKLKKMLKQMLAEPEVKSTPVAEHTQESLKNDEGRG